MELGEFRSIVNKSPLKEKYEALTFHVTFGKDFENIEVIGLVNIYKYSLDQFNSWQREEETSLNDIKLASSNYFKKISDSVLSFYKSTSGKNSFNQNTFLQHVNTNPPLSVFPYNGSIVKFIKKLLEYDRNLGKCAISFFKRGEIGNLNNKDEFFTYVLIFEYFHSHQSAIFTRSKIERSKFNDLEKKSSKLLSEIDEFYEEIQLELESEKNSKLNSFERQFEKEIKTFRNWFIDETVNDYNNWLKESKNDINSLRSTYHKLLKLKEPSQYWKDSSIRHNRHGWIFAILIMFFTFVSLWFIINLIVNTPDKVFFSWSEKGTEYAIRWIIIFVTLISLIVYVIKSLTKAMFSSFHLSRDSYERHILTYFYLSLSNDAKVGDEERHLIIQSLFSRSDTGLLKDDSGPNMPGDALSKVLGKG